MIHVSMCKCRDLMDSRCVKANRHDTDNARNAEESRLKEAVVEAAMHWGSFRGSTNRPARSTEDYENTIVWIERLEAACAALRAFRASKDRAGAK